MQKKHIWQGIVITSVALAGGTLWHERTAMQVWYNWRQLNGAAEVARPAWVGRLAQFEEAALPRLLSGLTQDDPQSCVNAHAVLAAVALRLQAHPERLTRWLTDSTAAFPGLSAAGQQQYLAFFLDVRTGQNRLAAADAYDTPLRRLLELIPASPHPAVHASGLSAVDLLLSDAKRFSAQPACREIVSVCLRHPEATVRGEAIRLAVRPEIDRREAVVPLLADPEVEVRKTALLAVGASAEVLATDDLLFWLHDPDPDVRRLCRQALEGRGLNAVQLKLGKLITDSRPAERLKVLDYLTDESDLSPAVWLRRLSHDPAPAVRAGALRAAGASPRLGLQDRLEQMAQNDPSPTVQQLAGHYLRTQEKSTPILSR